mmetsp:Transcript_29412/g.33989  ORF Transcript_29412/g.33989 Transcript_29412/m.33989 type:complete len:220 (-) Transcript_29412:76-735(-)
MSKISSGKASSVKIVLVGPSNAGKTSIAKRFTTDQFDEFQDMTVGSAFFSKQLLSQRHNASARVEVWDTAGQEKYRAMAPMYFRNAAGALLVFDQTSPSSFDDCERVWLPELLPHMKNSTQFIVMCGNKCDAIDNSSPAVAQFLTKVEAMCSSRGIKFFATSAKTGHHVTEVFNFLVDEILDYRAKEAAAAKAERSSVPLPVTVGNSEPTTTKKEMCCK